MAAEISTIHAFSADGSADEQYSYAMESTENCLAQLSSFFRIDPRLTLRQNHLLSQKKNVRCNGGILQMLGPRLCHLQ